MKHLIMKTIIFAGFVVMVSGCGDHASAGAESKAEGMEQTIAEVSEAAGLKNAEQIAGKLEQLLTAAMIEEGIGLAANKAEMDYYNTGDARNHYLTIKYPSDRVDERIKKMTGLTMPADDLVSIGSFQAEKLSKFEASWKQVTEDDVANLKASMEKRIADGSVKKETAEIAIGMSESELKYKREPVVGIGQRAVWVEKDKRLMIYNKGVSFYLHMETGRSGDEEKEMAIVLGKMILDKM